MKRKIEYTDLSNNNEANTEETERSKDVAVRLHFNPFLVSKGLKEFSQESEANLCQKSLFGELATYLTEKLKGDKSRYKVGSAIVMLGRIRTKVENRFPNNPIWIDYSSKWFSKITFNMTKVNGRYCNLSGETIEDKAPEVGRFLMKRIMKTYVQLMKEQNKVRQLAYRRVVLLMQFLAIGRCSEATRATWNRTKWYFDEEVLWMNWNEMKTGLQKPMTFNCDAECFEMDFFHAMGCYLMFCTGSATVNNPGNFIFPELATKSNPATLLDSWLKDLIPTDKVEDLNSAWSSYSSMKPLMGIQDASLFLCHENGKVKGLYRDTTMTSLRCGAVMECCTHPYVTEFQANQRGGWTEDNGMKVSGMAPTRMARYIRPCDHAVMRAGFGLSGFYLPSPSGIACAPKCSTFLDADSRNPPLAIALRSELFHFPTEAFYTGDLKEFSWVLLASQLMYLEEMMQAYGDEHPVVIAIVSAARRVGITLNTLKDWGKLIRDRWKEDNAASLTRCNALFSAPEHDPPHTTSSTEQRLTDITDTLKGQSSQISKILDLLQRQNSAYSGEMSLAQNLQTTLPFSQTPSSSNSSRSRSATDSMRDYEAQSKSASTAACSSTVGKGKKDIKDILGIMYLPDFCVADYFLDKREKTRFKYAKSAFFDELLTSDEKALLQENIYSPERRVQVQWAKSISERKSAIIRIIKRLLNHFNDLWMKMNTVSKCKRRQMTQLTWANINDKWPKVLQYIESTHLPKLDEFVHAARCV